MRDLFDWTEERVEHLKRLKAEGMTITKIGLRMGVSRNAVVGKLKRLGLTDTANSPIRQKPAEVPLKKLPKFTTPKNPVGPGMHLSTAKNGDCHWPLWKNRQSPNFLMVCGKPVVPGRSYCPDCCRKSEPAEYKWTEERRARMDALIANGATQAGQIANAMKAPFAAVEDRLKSLEAKRMRPDTLQWGSAA